MVAAHLGENDCETITIKSMGVNKSRRRLHGHQIKAFIRAGAVVRARAVVNDKLRGVVRARAVVRAKAIAHELHT